MVGGRWSAVAAALGLLYYLSDEHLMTPARATSPVPGDRWWRRANLVAFCDGAGATQLGGSAAGWSAGAPCCSRNGDPPCCSHWWHAASRTWGGVDSFSLGPADMGGGCPEHSLVGSTHSRSHYPPVSPSAPASTPVLPTGHPCAAVYGRGTCVSGVCGRMLSLQSTQGRG